MASACVYAPQKDTDLFYALKKELGYKKAWDVIGIINNPKFLQDFGDTLTLDSEGVPTLASVLNNTYIQGYIGQNNTGKVLQREYTAKEDTFDNYKAALEQARKFNTTSEHRGKFTAVVKYTEDGKLRVTIVPRSDRAIQEFENQYSSTMLNNALANILSPLGITYGMLTEAEQSAGRAGVIDFSDVTRMARDSISMIRVANNREGYEALSEEYSHLIVAAFRDTPLMQRLIKALAQDEEALKTILGNEYLDNKEFLEDMESLAEEAVGQLLREHFTKQVTGKSALINRLKNYIHAKYKGISEDEIAQALVESENALSNMAKNIMSGSLKVDVNAISERNLQLNSLSDRVERNINMLKQAKITELKRRSLSKDTTGINDTIKGLNTALNSSNTHDHMVGILTYAQEALDRLKWCQNALSTPEMRESNENLFETLRYVKGTMDSYGKFINGLNTLINEEGELSTETFLVEGIDEHGNPIMVPQAPELLSMLAEPIKVIDNNGQEQLVELEPIVKELSSVVKNLEAQYNRIALESFAEFLRPVLGDTISFELGKRAGTTISVIEALQKADSDISFFDRWLDSMGASNDIILKAFDEVVKRANERAKDEAQADIRQLQKIFLDAKDKGITDFRWAFEEDSDGNLTGDYIQAVNYNQYEKDKAEMEKALEEKYGKNPKGENLLKKKAEREAWHKEHSRRLDVLVVGQWEINPEVYKNAKYEALTSDQKEILRRFLEVKQRLDDLLPEKKVFLHKAVQVRRHSGMRVLDSLAHPNRIWENIKEKLAEDFLDRNDDNLQFGDNSRRGLTDFSGREYMELPALYTIRLENANDLSTDLPGTLMSYAAMARKYQAMENIVDALEVGRDVVAAREVQQTVGSNPMIERLKDGIESVTAKILERQGTNMIKKLDDFMASQVYNRMLKDSGTFDVFGKKVNKNKATSVLLKCSSLAQLGFNALANLANVAQGVAMQNIEAVAGEYFNAKELAKADAAYGKMLLEYFQDIGSRTPKSKLFLFDQAIDFKGDYFKDMKMQDMRKLTQRILGKQFAFIGQEAGDHWLYNRTAIAMAMRTKVNVPGKGEMSLWDALDIVDHYGDSRIKECVLPLGTTFVETGKAASLKRFGREVLEVNQGLFGMYNEEDSNAANRVIAGRLVMQYRKFMRPLWNKRFRSAQKSLITGKEYEGFYVTSGRVIMEMIKGQRAFMDLKSNLTEHQKKNITRTIADLVQFAAIAMLANLLDFDDDDDVAYAAKLANYMSKRLVRELGMFTPVPIPGQGIPMATEWLNTVQAPAASLSMIKDVSTFMGSVMFPGDWVDEIESGRYKGMSSLERAAYKMPIPYLSYYRQWDKVYNRIDEMADYYTRTR